MNLNKVYQESIQILKKADMSPKNVMQQCGNKSFYNMVVKEGYAADRVKRE